LKHQASTAPNTKVHSHMSWQDALWLLSLLQGSRRKNKTLFCQVYFNHISCRFSI